MSDKNRSLFVIKLLSIPILFSRHCHVLANLHKLFETGREKDKIMTAMGMNRILTVSITLPALFVIDNKTYSN